MMREPIYRVTNDDDPLDYDFPCAVSLATLEQRYQDGDDIDGSYPRTLALAMGESITMGGGAAVQFTITRIR